MTWLAGKKTYILVILGLLIQAVHFLTGDLSIMQFFASPEFQQIIELLGIGTIRLAVAKQAKAIETTPPR